MSTLLGIADVLLATSMVLVPAITVEMAAISVRKEVNFVQFIAQKSVRMQTIAPRSAGSVRVSEEIKRNIPIIVIPVPVSFE